VSFLKELKGITSLDLSDNNLSDVSFLKELKGITSLDLSDNNLSDVSFLKELKGITSLDLRNNLLNDVSFLKELKGITSLDLSDNPIVNPPKNIVDGGNEAIQEYFRQAEKYEIEKTYEAKILIVGESGVGKTTLMELLFNPGHLVPSPESTQPSTLGVVVKSDRLFKHPDKKLPNIKAHIWDFGGQDIQHMLHQYFLTDDCMYILLADESTDSAHYEYWFHVINLSGKNSPILVLLNRHKGQNAVIPFDAKLYKETFPNLKILDLGEIDLGNLDHRWGDLINELAFNLSKLPIVGQQTLKPWKAIREEIEKLRPKKYILIEDFDEICYRNGLEEQRDARFLLNYLHKIGFVLHYEEGTLQNTIFLDPNWITHAIYDVLSDAVIINKNGQFKKDQLYEHWQSNLCDKKHTQAYSQDECNYLLNLMLKNHFEVCYSLESKPSYYIVPTKLPNRKPEHEFEAPNSLRFLYLYPFIPEGLLSRLIVRMQEYIEEGKVWLTGAIFHKDGYSAVVLQQDTAQEGAKYIGISINGAELYKCQEFLRNIRREIEHIHRSTFPYIKYSEMVVCNCPVCKKHQTPNFYAYENLQTYLEERGKEIFCTVGNQKVDIRQMIDEVYLPEDFDRDGQKKLIAPKSEIKKKTIKIFLASSFELSEDRREFEIFINRKNKEYQKQGIFLKLVIWEDFIDTMPATRLQDEYNKAIADCDIFVSLFHTKVGKYTNEEFDKVFGSFKGNGKPLVYTYFKDAPINISKITPEINTLLGFKQKLSDLGHFHTIYSNTDDLKSKFGEQLEKVMEKL
ncbi:MAG: leucine-rich repeat domain-containing protein, partial [Bacteroidales bacterium]|nr:leucine-rich repeat domain-containing protein [Bacteroidales bacterium]